MMLLLAATAPAGRRQTRKRRPAAAAGGGKLLHPVPHQRRCLGQGPTALLHHREESRRRHSLAERAPLPGLPRRRSDQLGRGRGPFERRRFQGREIAGRRPRVLRQLPRQHRIHEALPPSPRTDQLAEYWTSGHGKALKATGDPKVATCISCHGKPHGSGQDQASTGFGPSTTWSRPSIVRTWPRPARNAMRTRK